jgi:hypothetical protein
MLINVNLKKLIISTKFRIDLELTTIELTMRWKFSSKKREISIQAKYSFAVLVLIQQTSFVFTKKWYHWLLSNEVITYDLEKLHTKSRYKPEIFNLTNNKIATIESLFDKCQAWIRAAYSSNYLFSRLTSIKRKHQIMNE